MDVRAPRRGSMSTLRGPARAVSRASCGGLVAALLAAACDRAPPRDAVSEWPAREPVSVGACEFRLVSATLHHSNAWQLGVEIEVANTGAESTYCAFAAQAMTSSDTPLTDRVTTGDRVAPTEPVSREIIAREADMTGMSTGRAEGAWVYFELSRGYWPIDTRVEVSADPERVRPPG